MAVYSTLFYEAQPAAGTWVTIVGPDADHVAVLRSLWVRESAGATDTWYLGNTAHTLAIWSQPIAANAVFDFETRQVVSPGQGIQFFCTHGNLVVTASGYLLDYP